MIIWICCTQRCSSIIIDECSWIHKHSRPLHVHPKPLCDSDCACHSNKEHYKFRGWVLYTRHVYWYAKDYTKIVVQPLIFPGIPHAPGAVPTYCLGPHWYTRHQAKLVLVYQHYLRHFQAIASMPGSIYSIHECIHACLVA